MLMIRLQRVGRRNDPSYRVVLTDKQNAPQSGKFKEILGSYDPRNDKPALKEERISYWIEKGAQPSDTVHNLLIDAGIIKGGKINVLPQKSPVVSEEEEKQKDAPAETEEAPTEDAPVEEPVQEEESAPEPEPEEPKEEEKKEENA